MTKDRLMINQLNYKRTPSDNYNIDLIIAEVNGISVDLVDSIPLHIVEQIRQHFYTQNDEELG